MPEPAWLQARNGDMAIGVIQASKEAGISSGEDILIAKIDAVRGVRASSNRAT